jgi:hypothetical protein
MNQLLIINIPHFQVDRKIPAIQLKNKNDWKLKYWKAFRN